MGVSSPSSPLTWTCFSFPSFLGGMIILSDDSRWVIPALSKRCCPGSSGVSVALVLVGLEKV